MKKKPLLILSFILALGLLVSANAQADQPRASSGILLRANLGWDPIGGGFAFGAGGGYRFPMGPNYVEILGDLYYGPGGKTWTDGNWSKDYTSSLFILAVRFNWLFFYKPEGSGIYPLVGVGLFAGNYSWNEVDTYTPSPSTTLTSSDSYFASRSIINLGVA